MWGMETPLHAQCVLYLWTTSYTLVKSMSWKDHSCIHSQHFVPALLRSSEQCTWRLSPFFPHNNKTLRERLGWKMVTGSKVSISDPSLLSYLVTTEISSSPNTANKILSLQILTVQLGICCWMQSMLLMQPATQILIDTGSLPSLWGHEFLSTSTEDDYPRRF